MATDQPRPHNVQNVLRFLDDLHRWELDHMPMLRTMTGRDVYLTLANLESQEGQTGISLKAIKSNNHYTDRAIAKRLSAMQEMALINIQKIDSDGRTKIIMPGSQLHGYFENHSAIFLEKIAKYFTLIPK